MKVVDLILVLAATVLLILWVTGAGPVLAPDPGPRAVVIVEESSTDRFDPEYVQLLKDPELRDYFEAKNHTFRLIEVDDEPAMVPYAEDVTETPWLVIETRGGQRLFSNPLPLPQDQFRKTLADHGG